MSYTHSIQHSSLLLSLETFVEILDLFGALSAVGLQGTSRVPSRVEDASFRTCPGGEYR